MYMGKWSAFVTSALDVGEWPASRPLCSSEERTSDTHQIVGWVASRVGLVLWIRKHLPHLSVIQPRFLRCQVRNLVTALTGLPGNLNPEKKCILELDIMPYTGDRPISMPLPTQITPNKIRENWQLTSMSQPGFEVPIQIFEMSMIVNALDCAATVIG